MSMRFIDPIQSHRFITTFEAADSDLELKFSRNVVSSNINLVSKKITVFLRENVNGDVFDVLSNLIIPKELDTFKIQILDKGSNTIFSLVFYDAKIIEHEQKFDYARTDNSMHVIQVSYRRAERLPNIK